MTCEIPATGVAFPLWDGTPPSSTTDQIPTLTPYPAENGKGRGTVIVCPGGGYSHLADHEGEPIAKMLNQAGINAFVLKYRIVPEKHPAPLLDAQHAIRTVRFNSEAWGLNPEKVGILGFSAGGHLTSSAGTHFDNGNPDAENPVERVSCRPDAQIPCYGAISFSDEFGHMGCAKNLFGGEPTKEFLQSFSNEKAVTKDTPPAFLWHTAEDTCVLPENSMAFAKALGKFDIPYSLHIFPHGSHGLGLAEDDPMVNSWTTLCQNWLKSLGF